MKTAVVFSGAGLSAESGVPTFRDNGGLWEQHKVEDVAHPDAWRKNPDLVLSFYEARFNAIKDLSYNAAHRAIAGLQSYFKVVNYTQNVDDFLERAGCDDVRHIHGSLFRKKCEFHSDIGGYCDFKVETSKSIEKGEKCPECGGDLRPDVVWFTEPVQNYEFGEITELCREVKYGDGVFICVGTSLEVYPAAYMVSFFSQVKRKFIVDLHPKRIADYELMGGKATKCMTELKKRLCDEEKIQRKKEEDERAEVESESLSSTEATSG